MDTSPTGGAAAREMPVIHTIMRTEFSSLPMLVAEVDPQDTKRVAAIAGHLSLMLDLLHYHHGTEDDLIWPPLKQRARLDISRIQRMEQQHEVIEHAVAGVRDATSAWWTAPTPATAGALTDSLDAFTGVLDGHLDEEERDVVPLIDQHLTRHEWQQVGDQSFAKFTPAQRWIALGLLTEVGTPESAAMLSELPMPVTVLWRLVGRRRYRRYIGPVREVS